MQKVSFSGHESFICKQFWLKKVYDFCTYRKSFSDDTAVVSLGVGKNMVASLRYWGKSFGILNDDDTPTDLAHFLFGPDGKDPYLEDLGTSWLLHYQLVSRGKASLYNFVFNEFRKERIDFTKDHLHHFLRRKSEEVGPKFYNSNTVNTDINVFFRNYVKPFRDEKVEIEEDFSSIFIDLDLIRQFKQRNADDKINNWYKIEGQDRIDLPPEIVLYAILDNYPGQRTINFRELQVGNNSPALVFALNAEGLYNKLIQITRLFPEITYTETAGNQVLQFKTDFNAQEILDGYYEG
jgi:hypothetical protein